MIAAVRSILQYILFLSFIFGYYLKAIAKSQHPSLREERSNPILIARLLLTTSLSS